MRTQKFTQNTLEGLSQDRHSFSRSFVRSFIHSLKLKLMHRGRAIFLSHPSFLTLSRSFFEISIRSHAHLVRVELSTNPKIPEYLCVIIIAFLSVKTKNCIRSVEIEAQCINSANKMKVVKKAKFWEYTCILYPRTQGRESIHVYLCLT